MKVSRHSTTKWASRNSGISRVRSVMDTRVATEVTNSSPPTGGVIMPSVRFTITTMAKCVGSMPRLNAMGARMGTRIITPGSGSMKMPNTSSRMFTAIRNRVGDSSQLTISSDRYCGMPSTVSTQAKAAEVAITSSTEAVSMAERAAMPGSADHCSVRYTHLPQTRA